MAVDGENKLTFQGSGTSDSYGALIDDVQVNASAVPEPASLAALAIGAFGILRQRQAKK